MLKLTTDITAINRVGAATAKKLKRLGIDTVQDLIFYFPFRYDDFSRIVPINQLRAGMSANVVGQIEFIQNKRSFRRRMYLTEALIYDGQENLKVIWFNQPFITRNLKVGDKISLAGKVEDDFGALVMKSPVYEKIQHGLTRTTADLRGQAVHTQGLVPNYHLTANITQKQIRFLIKQVINLTTQITDFLPVDVKKPVGLINLSEAIRKIHFPKTRAEIDQARKRLAFDELFLIQLQSQLVKRDLKSSRAQSVIFKSAETKKFVDSLPFKLTNAQRKAAWQILQDLNKAKPMSRLLEGDVGSGKTLVAVIAMLNVTLNGKQAVLMVPTEILAKQHYNTIAKFLDDFNVKIGLVTRSEKRTNFDRGIMKHLKNKKLNAMFITQNCDIIIGTHALIQENIKFKKLALAIIDEQHRFGVNQRSALISRTNADTTRTNADDGGLTRTNTDGGIVNDGGLLYEELTYKIREAIFNVKKELGLGHKEKIYQNALEQEFIKLGIEFEKEKTINIKYNNKKVGMYRPDFVIEQKIILEVKKLPFLGKFEKDQIWHYLKGSEYKLALLVNFGPSDVEIKRIVYDLARLQKSASVSISPHLLSMTATPIPRSLALALFGDLDLSIIDEMPKDRKKIITSVVPEDKRQKAYDFIRQQINQGRQVFVICPLIDPSDKLGVKSVQEEYKKLDHIVFSDLVIGRLHGRMKPKEKEKIMQEFLENKIKILVSTSVVEVGVDVPNAAIIMIEGADRFGLAQIHQFRGRVGRSQYQSYCFLFTDSESQRSLKRLEALTRIDNGFALAKIDLKFRGPGEIYGLEQKGFPELKIASLFDYQLMKLANEQAIKLINKDSSLNSWPKLKEKLGQWEKLVHLE